MCCLFSGMRILVNLLLDTLPMLGNVLLLCFFVFFIFGIIGVQLWAGLLRNRCYPEENFTLWVTACFVSVCVFVSVWTSEHEREAKCEAASCSRVCDAAVLSARLSGCDIIAARCRSHHNVYFVWGFCNWLQKSKKASASSAERDENSLILYSCNGAECEIKSAKSKYHYLSVNSNT